jgi:hypothetical protein
MKGGCDVENRPKGGAFLTGLQEAYVGAMIAAPVRKTLLRQPALEPDSSHRDPESLLCTEVAFDAMHLLLAAHPSISLRD